MKLAIPSVLLSLATSGCYVAMQKTTYVMQTEAYDEDDGMPAADMSISADLYEMAIGGTVSRIDFFAGLGVGSQRTHLRSPGGASEPDELGGGFRYFLGAAVTAAQLDAIRIRPYAIYGSDYSIIDEDIFDGDDLADSQVTSSKEIGIELDLVVLDDEISDGVLGAGAVYLRFGYASMQGKTAPNFFEDGEFDGSALLASFGMALSGLSIF